MNKFDKDYFDCPHCGIKNTTYDSLASYEDYRLPPVDSREFFDTWEVLHKIIRCTRKECERLTYFQILVKWAKKGKNFLEIADDRIIFQYPSGKSELPEYIPENIRNFYHEAVEAYNFGLLNSASIMCRKAIYELCDKKETTGRDYKEKIKNLGLDKRITDPLLNIKNIGDETVHVKGWDKDTIEKAIDVLGIIINMIYIQEKRIKDFTKHYSQAKQKQLPHKKQPRVITN